MTQCQTYTITERIPAGDADKEWNFARCNGDYIFAAPARYGGRLYLSANRGVGWAEEQPAGAADKYWRYGDVNASGQMVVGNSVRLYSKLAGVWVEERPAGDANLDWQYCAISPNGTRMMALVAYKRLYSYYDGSWTEEQPAGAADKGWQCCDITDDGVMIAAFASGRVYKKAAGGAWSETYPLGSATNKQWRGCAVSPDGTKFLVCANSDWMYRYADGAWTKFTPQPQYPVSALTYVDQGCDGNSDLTKIVACRDTWGGWTNATLGEIVPKSNWPTLSGSASGKTAFGGISADGTLMVSAIQAGRLYTYELDTLPAQTVGGFYKEFTASRAAGTAYNHKVRIRVYNKYLNSTQLHCEGRANTDFSDVYFKNAAGATLRHCIDDSHIGFNSIVYGFYYWVWVELDEVGVESKTFRMYYGDSSHADSSTAKVSFFDTYDGGERGVDNDAVGGAWTVVSGTVRISVDTGLGISNGEYSHRGTRSIEFVKGAPVGSGKVAIVAGDENYIAFYAYRESNGALLVQHGNGEKYVQFLQGVDGTVKNYTGGGYSASLVTIGVRVWYLYELRNFDWDAGTYDLYIGGTLRGEALAMQASVGHTDILTLSFGNGAGSGGGEYTVIDELIACTNCNPVPVLDSIGEEQDNSGGGTPTGPAGIKSWNGIASAAIKSWNGISRSGIKTIQ